MIILRHCESEFNRLYTLQGRDPGTPDPALSPQGQAHAAQLARQMHGLGITRILVSPYTRTLQTAAPIATALGITPEITPIIRERGMYSCDKGTPASRLAQAWPKLDFSALGENWWSPPPEPDRILHERAQTFNQHMTREREHERILVISHWWFLLALSGRSMENGDWMHHRP